MLAELRRPPRVLAALAGIPGLYLVGGYLRELYRGGQSQDIDLVAPQPLAPVLAAIAETLGVQPFEMNQRFQTYRFEHGGLHIDLTPLHEDGLAADLARRDYTVNTLAVPLARLGAQLSADDVQAHALAFVDLEQGVLRMLSAENLADDPLRIMRGYRLAACEGLKPEPQTRAAWAALAAHVTESAAERLHEELLAWLGRASQVAETLRWCAEDGVLWQLLPPQQQCVGCEQNGYHHLDVWQHTLEALAQFDAMHAQLPAELAPWRRELAEAWDKPVSGMANAGTLTRLALLLHDIGKPATRALEADGHISFHEHQRVGVELAGELLSRLKFAGAEIDYVSLLVQEHLRLGFYSEHAPLPPRLVYRFTLRLGAATPLALLHALADCAATRGPLNDGKLAEHLRAAAEILSHYYAQDVVAAPPVLLDGHAIMQLLSIGAGPEVGRLKAALLEATAVGEVKSVKQAAALLRRLHQQQPGGAE